MGFEIASCVLQFVMTVQKNATCSKMNTAISVQMNAAGAQTNAKNGQIIRKGEVLNSLPRSHAIFKSTFSSSACTLCETLSNPPKIYPCINGGLC